MPGTRASAAVRPRVRSRGAGAGSPLRSLLARLAPYSAAPPPVRRRAEAASPNPPPRRPVRGFVLTAVALGALVALVFACGRGGDGDPVFVQQTDPFGRELAPAVAREAGPAAVPARLAEAPAAGSIGDEALLYRVGESPCAVLRAGTDGLAAGLCGEELRTRVYLRPDRPMRLADLVARFAPFEIEVGEEEVELHGHGAETAGPIERRMVLEWARRLMAEARGVAAIRPYRLAFEWHRQLQGGRECQALAVYLSGEALAATCDGLQAVGTVPAARMAPILAWHDGLAPFQAVRQGGAGAESVSTRLIVPGAGDATQDDDTVKQMMALAEVLHGELLAADLARREAEEMRIALLESAALAEAQGRAAAGRQPPAGQPQPPAPPPTPAPTVEDAAEMTLSESIAVGADPEQVEELVEEAGPEEEGEGAAGAAPGGAAAAGEDEPDDGAGDADPPPEEADPTPDDGDGGGDEGGGGGGGGGGDGGGGDGAGRAAG